MTNKLFSGRGFRRVILTGLFIFFSMWCATAHAGTPPWTQINNQADVSYQDHGIDKAPISSNIASVTVPLYRTPATIEFLKQTPPLGSATPTQVSQTSYSISGTSSGPYVTMSPPLPQGHINPIPLTGAENYHMGEPLYIQVTDLDQNFDPTQQDSILVGISSTSTGDTEWLQLTETDLSTGVFVGYILSDSAVPRNGSGTLSVGINERLVATYIDPLDDEPTVTDAAMVDPYGIVFDSVTGQPVNGATVVLIDTSFNGPATVWGDDSISLFQPNSPATVTSGGQAVDSGGTIYDFPPGGFRFPFISPGNYRLEITPPAGYSNHTITNDFQLLQQLPGGPFALSDASIGEPFVVNPGPAIHIDVPTDPAPSGLWLTKDVNQDIVSTGDFLQYRLTLENLSTTGVATNLIVSDRLPLGFRYQSKSARQNGEGAADPSVAKNGRDVQFRLNDLGPGESHEISYVIEVAAGAKTGRATNVAQATAGASLSSNVATATVEVRPAFFTDATFLTGRVLTGECGQDDTEMGGLSGIRLYLEDGTYVITDEQGRYHFEGVEPGIHVVQADITSLPLGYEMIPCEETSQTAGRSFSQFVDLQGGSLWRVNFYAAPKPAPTGEVKLQMSSGLKDSLANFTLDLQASSIPLSNLKLTVMLPGQAVYQAGSTVQNDMSLDDPQTLGNAVTFRIDHLAANKPTRITFQAQLDTSQASEELPAKALLMFDTPAAKGQRTPLVETRFEIIGQDQSQSEEIKLYPHFPTFVAKLQDTDLKMLDQLIEQLARQKIDRVDIVGHTDNIPIATRSRQIFADNMALSVARAESVARYLQKHLDIPGAAISTRGMGAAMPVADNSNASGRSLNRRVELYLVSERVEQSKQMILKTPVSEEQSVATRGLSPAELAQTDQPHLVTSATPLIEPQIDSEWLNNAKPQAELIWPVAGYVPEAPSTSIMVQYQRGEKMTVTLNGEKLNPLNFDGVKNNQQGINLAAWKGVDLQRGQNVIEAVVTTAEDREVLRVTREIWYVDEPHYVELIPEQSHLVADGLNSPVLALRLIDKDGHPVRPGVNGLFRVDPPYLPAIKNDFQADSITATNPGEAHVMTGAQGIALAQLEPTTQSGEVVLRVPMLEGTEEIRAWLKPAPREWILVGFAEGTMGYNTFSGNQASLEEAGIDEHFYDDGQVKFFAKGAIKGEWLLTMAYDSDKPDLDGDSLYQIIDPDSYYPLYGDGTQQGYEASSASKIYVKLERDQFYALFGDMSTGLSQTELSSYNRSMNGFKSEMQGEKFSYTLFAAETKQAFTKDEIQGDGTSGRYYLSGQDIVINSETVTIETRDRFHSEKIIETQTLARHTDYDIDYDDGSLFFKSPVPSKDKNFNPIFIVARYETFDSADENFNYGGRAAVKLLDKKIEVGATYVHEEKGAGDGDLYGTDVTVELTPQTTLYAEMAATETQYYNDDNDGQAYLAEVRHSSNRTTGNAYYREQQGSFGLGQQNDSETSTRKYGVEGSYQLSPQVSVSGLAYHEDNLATDAKRNVAEFGSRYDRDRFGVHTGLRGARDKFDDGKTQTSNQWLIGGNWMTANRKLNLRSDYEQSLGNKDQNSDYPTLLTLGADYKLTEKISLFAEQEFSWGDEANTDGTRAGFKSTPWKGGDLRTAVEQQTNENGQRVFAIFGLGQSWRVNERWSFDASLDRGYTIKTPDPERVNNNVPPAHGADDDFTSVSVGSTYRKAKWTWWNRLETRQAQSEDKYGISTSVVGEPKDGVAVSAKALAFISEVSGGARHTDGNIRLGAAYRPSSSRWILLNRLDFYFDKMDDSNSDYDNWRIVNNLHANFRLNRKLQMSFYYGLKYVRDNYGSRTYSGYTDLIAFETRYNINKRWDVGLHGSMLHSWNSNQYDYSLGADVGYSPITNTWVSLGYNVIGFEDDDFSAAHYTAEGAYMRIRAKFDQQSVKDAAKWLNR